MVVSLFLTTFVLIKLNKLEAMNVTVFVPIQLVIKGDNKLEEVHEQLCTINNILGISELESSPHLNTDLVGDSEIVEDTEE